MQTFARRARPAHGCLEMQFTIFIVAVISFKVTISFVSKWKLLKSLVDKAASPLSESSLRYWHKYLRHFCSSDTGNWIWAENSTQISVGFGELTSFSAVDVDVVFKCVIFYKSAVYI